MCNHGRKTAFASPPLGPKPCAVVNAKWSGHFSTIIHPVRTKAGTIPTSQASNLCLRVEPPRRVQARPSITRYAARRETQ